MHARTSRRRSPSTSDTLKAACTIRSSTISALFFVFIYKSHVARCSLGISLFDYGCTGVAPSHTPCGVTVPPCGVTVQLSRLSESDKSDMNQKLDDDTCLTIVFETLSFNLKPKMRKMMPAQTWVQLLSSQESILSLPPRCMHFAPFSFHAGHQCATTYVAVLPQDPGHNGRSSDAM